MKMFTRPATEKDAGWIATLCYQQFQVAHREALQHDDMMYAIDKMFSPDAVKADIQQKDHYYFVVTDERNNPLGCVKLGPVELDLAKKIKGAVELTRFYVYPEMIGKSVAALLIKACVDFVRAHRQYHSIWLHVYERNFRALRFYEKMGFVNMGTQLYPVRNSIPTGIVMSLEVK